LRIEVKNLTKRFEHTLVLDRINLESERRSSSVFWAPSGSGKTTLLRIIAGLEFADAAWSRLTAAMRARSASRSAVRFVFQQYALFNHMTVFENVALA